MLSGISKSDPRVSLSECSSGLSLLLFVLDETVTIFSFLTEINFFKDSLLTGSLTKERFSLVPLFFQLIGESEQECRSFPGCFLAQCFLVHSPAWVIFSEGELLFLDNSSSLWLPVPGMLSAEGEHVLAMNPSKESCSCCSGPGLPRLSLEVTMVSRVEAGTRKESRDKGFLASPVIFWNWRGKQQCGHE